MKRGYRYRIKPEISNSEEEIDIGLKHKKMEDTTHVYLGNLSEQGSRKKIRWSFERETVVGIFGKRGSGKSYTLGTMIEGLSSKDLDSGIGYNVGDRGVLLFDTLNIFQYSTVAVSKIKDEQLRSEFQKNIESFNIKEGPVDIKISYPAGRNLSFYPHEYEPFALDTSLILPEDYGHIFDIDIYKDPMGHLILSVYGAVKFDGYDNDGNQIPGSSSAGLSNIVECLTSENSVTENFSSETVRGLLSRMRTISNDSLFSSPPVNVNDMLKSGSVRVLLMGQLQPSLRSVVAALLIRQIFKARSAAAEAIKLLKINSSLNEESRVEIEKLVNDSPPRTLVCIDEIQGYAPPSKLNPCTEIIIQYVKEGRNHGLSLIGTSQQPSAIHHEVLSQLDGIIAHQLTVNTDIDTVLKHGKSRSPEKISSVRQVISEADLIRELAIGQAWVSHSDVSRSFVINIRPRVTAHGGIEV